MALVVDGGSCFCVIINGGCGSNGGAYESDEANLQKSEMMTPMEESFVIALVLVAAAIATEVAVFVVLLVVFFLFLL